ncbi:C2 domain-containing protein [Purpureocillium lavendulum]|uniref:C2 domain-containing protein n=1 Tax=Purpureocillium lavendulum TaxID=1247861 RepID=A0AB34G1A5_9HYPO|nr:C2 domain-containing protein [Purpureocillium lavendulum]
MSSSGDISPGTVNGVSREASATHAPQQAATNGTLPLQPAGDDQQAQPNGGSNGNGPAPKKRESRTTELMKTVNPTKKGPPGGFDTTPLPDAPPGYTVRFVFRCAANLPPADFNTASSDPFLTATLKTSLPKRHKEDPDLVHRTRTLRRTTEPEWNDEWVVANVPRSGFTLKCRLYDEDSPDSDDRLGNVTIRVPQVYEQWEGLPPPGKEFGAKKRMISKRAFLLKGLSSILHSGTHITPRLTISIEVLGKSDPPHAQMYTLGPTTWIKHFSPMIGRLAGIKVNANEEEDQNGASSQTSDKGKGKGKGKSQKYDFQANEMQLQGPVPPALYHRYVQFRPVIGAMFASTGLRGKILNTALHKQHNRVYNFDRSTEYGTFHPCTEEASLQFLRMAHFDEGGRIFTYVLTLDGLLRFTETGKEFGIDMLSKHTMHSNVETYIACSGEFFIRRLQHAHTTDNPEPKEKTHPDQEISGGPPKHDPPPNPSYYQLVIDNDSGTYRPDKSILPELKAFLHRNFPGLGVVAMHWEEEKLQKLKEAQRSVKKKEGRMINVVMNRSMSSISSAESELEARDSGWEQGKKSKREAALEAVEDPSKLKDVFGKATPHQPGESSRA